MTVKRFATEIVEKGGTIKGGGMRHLPSTTYYQSSKRMPKILDRAASQIKKRDKKSRWAIATSALQKAGVLKKGTNKLTEKGRKRQSMSASARAKSRAAKTSGKSTRNYKYNSSTNRATLRNK